mmetsp:Transcript_3521/g.5240  ORF Transcript_3521/g.5240 Transcript_3521/m.5240 type:complete len:129 (-) Transcript_3521:148-534(-)
MSSQIATPNSQLTSSSQPNQDVSTPVDCQVQEPTDLHYAPKPKNCTAPLNDESQLSTPTINERSLSFPDLSSSPVVMVSPHKDFTPIVGTSLLRSSKEGDAELLCALSNTKTLEECSLLNYTSRAQSP